MSESNKPIVNGEYLLQKFSGKGGWTYALIPEITPDKHAHFGWVTVRGRIDDYVLHHHKLMPFGNGQLFLSVKAAIRKKIKKEAGDSVHIVLSLDTDPLDIPTEIMDCFACEASATLSKFKQLTLSEQKTYLDWIGEAKTEATKISRIAEMMNQLSAMK